MPDGSRVANQEPHSDRDAMRVEPNQRGNAASETARKPPLSIAHLLLWTAMSGAVMGAVRYIAERDSGRSGQTTAWDIGMLGVLALYGGVVTSGVVIWLARRIRGIRFPTEPGEWLLVVPGLLAIVALAGFYVSKPDQASRIWLGIVICCACFLIGMFPRLCYRGNENWRVVFTSFAILMAMPIVVFGFSVIAGLGGPAPPVLLYVLVFAVFMTTFALFGSAVSIDYHSKHAQRGWMHWVGVASLASLFVGAVVALILPALLA